MSTKDAAIDWESLQVFPNRWEQIVFSRLRWFFLIAYGPLAVLLLANIRIERLTTTAENPFRWTDALFDLTDRIFVFLSTAFFISGLLLVRYWIRQLRGMWLSLEKKRGRSPQLDQADRAFFDDVQGRLLSPRRFWLVGFVISVMLLISYLTFSGRADSPGYGIDPNATMAVQALQAIRITTRWFLSLLIWGYFSGIALWMIGVTSGAVPKWFNRFQPPIYPHHPDRAGGFQKTGALFAGLLIPFAVFLLTTAYLGGQGLNDLFSSLACLTVLENVENASPPVPPVAIVNCMDKVAAGVGRALPPDVRFAVDNKQLALTKVSEKLLKDLACPSPSEDCAGTLRNKILRYQQLTIYLIIAPVLILLLLLWLVGRPLWFIYTYFQEKRARYEAALITWIQPLDDTLGRQVLAQDFESAVVTRAALANYETLYPDRIHYPALPLRLPALFARLFSPSVIAALLGYLSIKFPTIMAAEIVEILKAFISP